MPCPNGIRPDDGARGGISIRSNCCYGSGKPNIKSDSGATALEWACSPSSIARRRSRPRTVDETSRLRSSTPSPIRRRPYRRAGVGLGPSVAVVVGSSMRPGAVAVEVGVAGSVSSVFTTRRGSSSLRHRGRRSRCRRGRRSLRGTRCRTGRSGWHLDVCAGVDRCRRSGSVSPGGSPRPEPFR